MAGLKRISMSMEERLLNIGFEEEYGYPMPGITVMGGVDTRF
jgi:hypothetical protein